MKTTIQNNKKILDDLSTKHSLTHKHKHKNSDESKHSNSIMINKNENKKIIRKLIKKIEKIKSKNDNIDPNFSDIISPLFTIQNLLIQNYKYL